MISEKLVSRQRNSPKLRRNLLEKFGHACVACGIKDDVVPLEIAYLTALSEMGEYSDANSTLLCPNCHRSFDRQPREIEFVNFLAELLSYDKNFTDVELEPLLGRETRYRVDLLVTRQRARVNEVLLIECKTQLTSGRVSNVIEQLEKYKASYGDCRMVLAVPATIIEADVVALQAAHIEIWDLRYIASNFSEQIHRSSLGYYKVLLLTQISRSKKRSREEELLMSLASCIPGRPDCYVYQTLVGEILECLFSPPLGRPISESSDKSETNRRDFIMPNYTVDGFWSFLRKKYDADYIVIDAKNYTRKVKKTEVLQIANYLKPHGAGLFGLIFSRKGGDSNGCEHTLREQWLVHRKLILVLDDGDIKAMLMAKSDGRPAEEILGQKIEHFRLSM